MAGSPCRDYERIDRAAMLDGQATRDRASRRISSRKAGSVMRGQSGLGPSFESTLAAAAAGDSDGFELIYQTFAGRVRAFGLARGTPDAEELANDVMLRVFQNLGSFSGDEASFVRWVFTVARNRLIDMHRATQRRPQIAERPIPERTTPAAETTALESLSLERVAEVLDVLTPEQREVIALRLVADLALADVAEIVGRPVTAVKALQRRGLQRLQREILDEVVS